MARANAIASSISVINRLRAVLAKRNAQLPSTSTATAAAAAATAAAAIECLSESDEEEEDRSPFFDESRSVALCGPVSASSQHKEQSDDSEGDRVAYIIVLGSDDEQQSESNDDASHENPQWPINAPILKEETPEHFSQHALDPFDDTEWLKDIELTVDFEGLLDLPAEE